MKRIDRKAPLSVVHIGSPLRFGAKRRNGLVDRTVIAIPRAISRMDDAMHAISYAKMMQITP